jgi:Protein of unknown function, DUF417
MPTPAPGWSSAAAVEVNQVFNFYNEASLLAAHRCAESCPPGGWEPSAGGFPAMVGPNAFLMKDVVLLGVRWEYPRPNC